MPENISEMVQEQDFWVFDDMASELKNNTCFTNFFTKTAHHKNCLMAYLTQNAYEAGVDRVTRSHNCAYQVYFNNKVDCHWIRVLGDQLTSNLPVCLKKPRNTPMIPCYVIIVKPRLPMNNL